MVCTCIGNCQLVSNCDGGDCREISLTRRRLVALVAVFIANGSDWYKWIIEKIRILNRDWDEWMGQRRSSNNNSNDLIAV